jgi:L-fuconolactonase
MEIIDSHQHFWQVGKFEYPWMSSDVAILYRDYLPATLKPIIVKNGVAQTVVVQASNSPSETRWMLKLAATNKFIAGVVGWVDLTDPELEQALAGLTKNTWFKGVRHLVESEANDDWLIQAAVIQGLQTLAAHNVPYDMLVHTRHLKRVRTVAEECPGLSLVIDHVAKPPIVSGAISEWMRELKPVAAFPNIYCKLSGLVTEADHKSWKVSDLRPYVDCALELFGPRRLLFGSDYPVCLLAGPYERVLGAFQELLKHLNEEDREQIFRENAREFYRLN